MNDQGKKIWYHKSNKYVITIYKRKDGILCVEGDGIVSLDSVKALLDFLNTYKIKIKKRIKIVFNDSNVKSIDAEARQYITKFTEKNGPLLKSASIGNNFFMRSFINLYSTLIPKQKKIIGSFKTLDKAVEWLKK